MVASILQHGLPLREDAVHEVAQPSIGQTVLIFPIGPQRFRTYFMYRKKMRKLSAEESAHAEQEDRAWRAREEAEARNAQAGTLDDRYPHLSAWVNGGVGSHSF